MIERSTAFNSFLDADFADAPHRARLMAEHQPAMSMAGRTFFAGVAQGKLVSAAP